METFYKVLQFIDNNILWGVPMICLILGTGIFLTVRTRAMQVRKLGFSIKMTLGDSIKQMRGKGDKEQDGSNISPFEAFSTAVSGTIGTGNIVGVTTAIVAGGPGAVFWMWVSALFGCVTKYAEITLGLFFRKKDKSGEYTGGPAYYLRYGLNSKFLSCFFAIATAIACIFMGALQADTIETTISTATNNVIPTYIIAIVIAVLAGLVIIGGIKRIGKAASILVPFMAILFIIVAVVLVLINVSVVPSAFAAIFVCAFTKKSVIGGFMGYGIATAMRLGFARGVFSNEAGLGSSSIAHSTSSTKEPVKQGMWGIFEVFLVSFIICTLTALLILTSGVDISSNREGADVAMEAFTKPLGTVGIVVYSIILPLFAFSTILAWAVYGSKSLQFVFNKNTDKTNKVFNIIFILMIIVMAFFVYFFGENLGANFVWTIQDMANALMAIPNLIGLILLSGTLLKITKNYFDRRNGADIKPMISAYTDLEDNVKE